MNDFFKAMSQFGMENIISGEHTMTLEEEMNSEIAMEAEIDEAHYQMDCANILASTTQCEAILSAMAEREIGLECNDGRDPLTIYSEFGLEAVKDIAMRKVYSGVASLKALINTIINWFKQLLGIAVTTKKIFSGLAKKAKAMKKQLAKVQVKVSEKLKRDMPKYAEVFNSLVGDKSVALKKAPQDPSISYFKLVMSELPEISKNQSNNLLTAKKDTFEKWMNQYDKTADTIKEWSEKLDDVYDKTDTDEYEGSACYNHIKKSVDELEKTATSFKGTDLQKTYEKAIKSYEDVRKQLDKKEITVNDPENLRKWLNRVISVLGKAHNCGKKVIRLYVKAADDCLTMAKGVYATLV